MHKCSFCSVSTFHVATLNCHRQCKLEVKKKKNRNIFFLFANEEREKTLQRKSFPLHIHGEKRFLPTPLTLSQYISLCWVNSYNFTMRSHGKASDWQGKCPKIAKQNFSKKFDGETEIHGHSDRIYTLKATRRNEMPNINKRNGCQVIIHEDFVFCRGTAALSLLLIPTALLYSL